MPLHFGHSLTIDVAIHGLSNCLVYYLSSFYVKAYCEEAFFF